MCEKCNPPNASILCPKCGYHAAEDFFTAAVRTGPHPTSGYHVIDVGFKCPDCKTEFGFEVFNG